MISAGLKIFKSYHTLPSGSDCAKVYDFSKFLYLPLKCSQQSFECLVGTSYFLNKSYSYHEDKLEAYF